MKTVFIVNSPAARRNTDEWHRITYYIGRSPQLLGDILMTERPGQASEMARDAVRAGCQVLVAVGGDGTVNEVLNGLSEAGASADSRVVLGTIPLGSGCDLARSLGLSRKIPEALEALEKKNVVRIDVGRVHLTGLSGQKETRLFANIGDLGAGGVVVQQASRSPRVLGRRPNYFWGILAAALSYKARMVSVSIDGGQPVELAVRNMIIANGRYFGRGFLAAPQARMDDGLFDIVNIGDFSTVESVRYLPSLYRGTYLGLKKVRHYRGKTVEVEAAQEVLIELDGELAGKLPATFEVVPGAVDIIAGQPVWE